MTDPLNPEPRAVLTRKELEGHSCPCCFRPLKTRGYCDRCEASGGASRHRQNQMRGRADERAENIAESRRLSEPKPAPFRNRVTREMMVAAVLEYMTETGRVPTRTSWEREGLRPGHTHGARLFGSWAAMLEACGVQVRRSA